MGRRFKDLICSLLPKNTKSTFQRITNRVVIMGPEGVGKTCIINRLLSNTFTATYERTNLEKYNLEFSSRGMTVHLQIIDTCGAYSIQEQTDVILSGHVFVLVYNVNDLESFEKVGRLRDEIQKIKGSDEAPILVIGNKADSYTFYRPQSRIIEEDIVSIDWEHDYLEVSAKMDYNVSEVLPKLFKLLQIDVSLPSPKKTSISLIKETQCVSTRKSSHSLRKRSASTKKPSISLIHYRRKNTV